MTLARDIDTSEPSREKRIFSSEEKRKHKANFKDFMTRKNELGPYVKQIEKRSPTSWHIVLFTQEAFMLFPRNRRCKNYNSNFSFHYGSIDELISWIKNKETKVFNMIDNARNQRKSMGLK